MPYNSSNPFYRNPDHPNFNRRSLHHDYCRPARYLITIIKNPSIPPFCSIHLNPSRPGDKETFDKRIILTHTAAGQAIRCATKEWLMRFPHSIRLTKMIIMPDHIHICLEVTSFLPNNLSRAIASFKGLCSRRYHQSLPAGQRPDKMQSLFTKGFNDRIAYDYDQWLSQMRYVSDNPRRYIIKQMHPDYLRHRWLLTIGEQQYELMGNIFLLRQPHLFQVKIRRKFTETEKQQTLNNWHNNLLNGGIPISPFIHPKEKELRDIAVKEGYAYIRICTNGFAEREAAYGREFELMAQGRLLLIGQPEYQSQKIELRYKYAQMLNQLAARIASECNQGIHSSIRLIRK